MLGGAALAQDRASVQPTLGLTLTLQAVRDEYAVDTDDFITAELLGQRTNGTLTDSPPLGVALVARLTNSSSQTLARAGVDRPGP